MGAVLLRLTLADGRRLRTVGIRAPHGTSWAVVAPHLGLSSTTEWMAEYAGTTVPLTPGLILGTPPLVHGVVVLPRRTEPRPGGHAPVSLRVASGPDVGGSYALRPGLRVTVGRGPWCDVIVDDPGLSRHHLTLTTTRDGVVVDDASSTNGTRLDGTLLEGPTVWRPGLRVRAGATTFDLTPDPARLPRGRPDDAGRILVIPRQRRPPPVEPAELTLPQATPPEPPAPPSVLAWLLPLVVSVLLAVVLSMPALMLFGLMAPAMTLGSHAGERRRFRRASADAARRHSEGVAATRRAAAEAVALEVRRREERVPDLALLIQEALATAGLLWSRTGEDVVCRLGTGPLTTAVTLDGVPQRSGAGPVEVDVAGGLVLVGPPDRTRAAARSVVAQLAILHPPTVLRIRVSGVPAVPAASPGGTAPWDWCAWLPHAGARSADRAARFLTVYDLSDDPDAEPAHATTHGTPAAPAGDEGASGIPIYLCRSPAQAPDVATVVNLRGTTGEVWTGAGSQPVVPDRLSEHRATVLARALAALRAGGEDHTAGSLPAAVSFAAIAPVPLDGSALAQSWRRSPRTTRFVLGRGADGDTWLDLAEDGPHALVAGTTGAGKSELLRTLVTSLALGNRPDELVMVLVDYKGGSAFAEATALPHVVGMVTDLDPHLADRALTSLTAELKRRERVLAAADVPDLPAHQALPDRDPLPRLVIVIDEFRALAEELPGFLDGLVRIAALGRSLGVHLVLATQRPGGVVSADVRANVNLRIALRVRDASDSYDVIDSPAAADLPEGRPGRALIRTGASPPREVQVASTSTGSGQAGSTPGLSVVPVTDPWAPDTHPAAQEAGADPGEGSTLARAAAAAGDAARQLGAVPPPSPWLPALPPLIALSDLGDLSDLGNRSDLDELDPTSDGTARDDRPDPSSEQTARGEQTAPGEQTAYRVPLLLTDLPDRQAQPVHHWCPLTDGHLGVVGAGRTGRSTVVRTVLAGLLSGHPDDTHCYVFDLAGGLGPVADAPHVGAALGAADVALGCRVIDHLVQLVATRQRELAAAGHTTLAEQRASGDRPWPLVVLVIDGWPRFAELFGEADRGRPLDQVQQLLREGLGAGVVAVVTGDRSLLGGRIGPLLTDLWSLRLTDPADLLMAGLTRAQVPVRMPPGRAIRLRDGVVGQVAVVGEAAEGAAQVSALATVARGSLHQTPTDGPARFVRLPRTVRLDGVADPVDGLLVGVGGDAAEPVTLTCVRGAATVAGVLGPPRSGRSTTLRTLAASARSQGWTVVDATARLLRDAPALEAALRAAAGDVLVTVDGLDQVAQTAAEDALLTWVEEPVDEAVSRVLVVAGGPEDFGGFRGLGARIQRERTGMVLQPTTPADGSGLGVAVPTGDEPLPGRGVLVRRGVCTAVQVAHTDERPE